MNKYGLVWDEEKNPEAIVNKCNKKLPYVKQIKKYSSKKEGTSHALIEGDNYASLKIMQETHRNAIDIICIDPPYNTEKGEFIYNDKRVDDEDNYRHSKWLNFMDKRIRLAYNLLKEDGVLYMFIGKDELANLTLLTDQIFGEKNRVTTISRITKKTSARNTSFEDSCDYILVYAKSLTKVDDNGGFGVEIEDTYREYSLVLSGISVARPNQRYWVECPDGEKICVVGEKYPSVGSDECVPSVKGDRLWYLSKEGYEREKAAGNLIFKKNTKKSSSLINDKGEGSLWRVSFKTQTRTSTRRIHNFITDNEFTNNKGTEEVKELFGHKAFDYPKPTALIKYLIKITNKPKNITVLDFFAGSGTTGHAVIDLNIEDNGTRNSIMCALNDFDDEVDICTDVTYKRLNLVVEKKRKEIEKKKGEQISITEFKRYDGFPPSLIYFRVMYAQNNDLSTKMLVDERNKETLQW